VAIFICIDLFFTEWFIIFLLGLYMNMSDWHRVDNQPSMSGQEMKSFLTSYSQNLSRGLEVDMIGGGDTKAYCMSCKKKQDVVNPTLKKIANKKTVMLQGTCKKCNGKVSTFLSSKK
jgi:hypothetical protein